MACPTFSVSGYALPGVPGAPHFSHNEHVAWGMTHGYADYQDLFIERFRGRDGTLEYAWQDDWHPAEVADETLYARDAVSETLRVVATRHGPVIAGDPHAGHGLAFSHPGTNSGTPWANTLYDLLRARSADEAEEALRPWTEPVNNFVYADVHGEFGYRYRGRIPIRPMANAWTAAPGWDGQHEWQGNIPFDDMPQTRNPSAGYVVTCNQGVAPTDYPYYINTYFGADTRARRVTARLQELAPGAATVADMAAVHADRLSRPAQICLPVLAQTPLPSDPRVAEARNRLLAWDCHMDRDSVAATVYAALRACWLEEVLKTRPRAVRRRGYRHRRHRPRRPDARLATLYSRRPRHGGERPRAAAIRPDLAAMPGGRPATRRRRPAPAPRRRYADLAVGHAASHPAATPAVARLPRLRRLARPAANSRRRRRRHAAAGRAAGPPSASC